MRPTVTTASKAWTIRNAGPVDAVATVADSPTAASLRQRRLASPRLVCRSDCNVIETRIHVGSSAEDIDARLTPEEFCWFAMRQINN
jgi:hypothetical protein